MSEDIENNGRQSSSAADDTAELLPWYVNGTLSEDEKTRVDAYLDDYPEARKELELLRQVAAHSIEDQPEPPGELGLTRLRRDIRRQDHGKGSMSRWWRPVAIAASLVLAVQSVLLIWPRDAGEYRLAGGTAAEVQITFVPQASEQSIRALLQELGAEIVGGPGRLGVYHLSFDSSTDIEQVLARLRARNRVVSHASRS
ncbi:MAG: hypothetical protein U5P41_08295 [Gammaproteobacteria bacterium]|nr:hypothetical protein [Gammaproteobacteria bacterium]